MRSAEGHDLPSLDPGIPGSPAVTGKDEIPAAQSNTELNVISGRALLQSHDCQGGTASCTMGGVTALPPLPLHSRSARGNKLPVRLGKTQFVLVDGLTVIQGNTWKATGTFCCLGFSHSTAVLFPRCFNLICQPHDTLAESQFTPGSWPLPLPCLRSSVGLPNSSEWRARSRVNL